VGWLRATAATPLPREVVVDDGTNYAELHYRPIGVVGAITPWNWPLIIRVVMGGDPDTSQPGFFYPKTLIADIDNDAALVQEEQFGPALPIIRYTDLEQAIECANGVDVGLGASVWSADRDKAKEIAARLEAGTVWINGHGGLHPMVPFGGAKHSGYGLESGVEGLKSVSVPQVING
jgi:phenylacetaldehyde dehydrogenase